MNPRKERAESLADAIRAYVPDGLQRHLDKLTELASSTEPLAQVLLFKPSGKHGHEEYWRIPASVPDHSPVRGGDFTREALGPWDMRHSPDFHTIDGGPVLVLEQEPWGYPFLLLSKD